MHSRSTRGGDSPCGRAGLAGVSEAAPPRDPVEDLRRIAFLLERTLESSYRVKAFRTGGRGAGGAAA